MKFLRYFVSTRKKQWRLLILCLMLTIAGYFYWLSIQWRNQTRSDRLQFETSKLLISTESSNIVTKDLPVLNNDAVLNTVFLPDTTHILKETLIAKKASTPRDISLVSTKHEKVVLKGSNNESNSLTEVSYNVHIFYYPWYGNPATDGKYIHWNHEYLPHWNKEIAKGYKKGSHKPPDDIGADFYPELGCYSSNDDHTIREHMRQIRTSGAGVVVVSWYPKGAADQQGIPVDRLVPKLLDIAAEFRLKVTLHIEPYQERNERTVRDDAVYIHKMYAHHPAFYKYKTKDNRYLPLLYIYDSYHTKPKEWANLLNPNGKYTIRNTPYDCVMIALMVDSTHKDYINVGGFDGFYTYFAVNGFTYGSRWNEWSSLKSFAKQTNTIFIPSVGPGYIDTSIRPWNYANTRSRENGEYYKRSFQSALSVKPRLISITSFNEWHEGTQIEQAVPRSGHGFKYQDYLPNQSDYYLKLTRTYVQKFKKWDKKRNFS